jgi:hypothetical protein
MAPIIAAWGRVTTMAAAEEDLAVMGRRAARGVSRDLHLADPREDLGEQGGAAVTVDRRVMEGRVGAVVASAADREVPVVETSAVPAILAAARALEAPASAGPVAVAAVVLAADLEASAVDPEVLAAVLEVTAAHPGVLVALAVVPAATLVAQVVSVAISEEDHPILEGEGAAAAALVGQEEEAEAVLWVAAAAATEEEPIEEIFIVAAAAAAEVMVVEAGK